MSLLRYFICVAMLSAGQTAGALVHGCNDAMTPSTPLSRFEFLQEGHEIKDKVTGLIWKRCPEGRSWTGSQCAGTALRYDWSSAIALADDTWRLPNIKELESIAEVACYTPSLNKSVFNGTPHSIGSRLWSASPNLHNEQRMTAWYFHPDSGSISFHEISNTEFVRMVR